MYPTFLQRIARFIPTAVNGTLNVHPTRGRLHRRQSACSTSGTCSSGYQCCGGYCILFEFSCCPGGTVYCPVGYTCNPCPPGQTCQDDLGNVSLWICCPSDGGCGSIVSSPTSMTAVSSSSPTPTPISTSLPPAPSPATTMTIVPPPPTSPTPPAPSPATTVTIAPPSPTSPAPAPQQSTSTPPVPSLATTVTIAPPPTSPAPAPQQSTPTPSAPTQTSTQSSVSASTIGSARSSSTTHSSIPTWNGSGPLLVGYCATPEFSLVYGPQTTAVYFIGIVGCMGDKTDCCPFQVSSTTTTTTVQVSTTTTKITTVTTTSTQGVPPPANANQYVFPGGATSSEVTLPRCPDDYVTVSSVCCPSGYVLWEGGPLGGITPCYSTVSSYLTPPPVENPSTVIISSSPVAITSTILDVVYARNYPVNGTQTGLTTSAKAGVGAGVGVGAITLAGLAFWFWAWRRRRPGSSPYPPGGGSSPMQIIPPVQPP